MLLGLDSKDNIVHTLNPHDTSSSDSRSHTSGVHYALSCPKFAPISVLDDPRYVQDDTLFIKAIVGRQV